jgi:hypothetical protein
MKPHITELNKPVHTPLINLYYKLIQGVGIYGEPAFVVYDFRRQTALRPRLVTSLTSVTLHNSISVFRCDIHSTGQVGNSFSIQRIRRNI